MTVVRFKIEIHGKLDTDEFPIPADGNLSLQLKEEVRDAIESSISIEINNIKVTRSAVKNEEVRDFD